MSLVLQDQLVLSPATAEHLQEEIDTIEAGSDVTDVVGTYADLQSYDTSTLTDKDVIKVLDDETENHAQTYYRWSTSSQSFSYVGQIAKPAVDSVNGKTGAVVLDSDDVGAVAKTSTASKVYGTDASGNQTTYDKDSFGQVDDVQVNGTSVVSNKVANLGTMASESASDYLPLSGGTMTGDVDFVENKLKFGTNSASGGSAIWTDKNGYLNLGYRSNSSSGAISLWVFSPGMGTIQPRNNNAFEFGSSSNKIKAVYTGKLNNGSDIAVPNTAGTMVVSDYTGATQGQVLTLDSNSNAVWADVDSLPSQTGQSGKILGTDGTNAAWETKTTVSFRTWGVNE